MQNKSKEKNVILGLAYDANDDFVAPFLNSLNTSGFEGDLVLFTNHKTNLSAKAYGFNVILVNQESNSRWLFITQKAIARVLKKTNLQYLLIKALFPKINFSLQNRLPLSKFYLSIIHGNFYFATARYFYCLNYLNAHPYDNVFLTDVSDVFFQSDVFSSLKLDSDEVEVFEEDIAVKIKDSPPNYNWIKVGFDNVVLQKLIDKPIYCSGTILGTYGGIVKFLNDFVKNMTIEKMPVKMIGFDQGMFNYMVSYLKLPYLKSKTNGNTVYTVGLLKSDEYKIVNEQIYCPAIEMKPAVVHQYNRHADMLQLVKKLYR